MHDPWTFSAVIPSPWASKLIVVTDNGNDYLMVCLDLLSRSSPSPRVEHEIGTLIFAEANNVRTQSLHQPLHRPICRLPSGSGIFFGLAATEWQVGNRGAVNMSVVKWSTFQCSCTHNCFNFTRTSQSDDGTVVLSFAFIYNPMSYNSLVVASEAGCQLLVTIKLPFGHLHLLPFVPGPRNDLCVR